MDTKPWVVEAKVIASTFASAAIGTTIAVLNDVETHNDMLGDLPAPVQAIVLIVIPTVITFMTGWTAKHTSRSDFRE